MTRLTARVRHGHPVLPPTSLPDGTEFELAAIAEGDTLTDEERASLHAALQASWQDAEDGHLISADEVLAELASRS